MTIDKLIEFVVVVLKSGAAAAGPARIVTRWAAAHGVKCQQKTPKVFYF